MPDQLEGRLVDHVDHVDRVDHLDHLDRVDAVSDHVRIPAAGTPVATSSLVGSRLWALAAAAVVVALVGVYVVVADPDETNLATTSPAEETTTPTTPADHASAATTTSSADTTTTTAPARNDEEADAQRRELDQDLAAVQRYYRPPLTGAEPPPQRDPEPAVDFGGIAFDTTADPVRLTVTFWRNVDHHRAALQPLLAHSDRVDIVLAPEIDMAALSRALDEQLPEGSWFERPNGNTSRHVGRVTLYEGYEEVAERLLEAHGTSVQLFVGAFPYPIVPGYGPVCQDPPAADRTDIRVDVAPRQTSWRLGEPIAATVTVVNDGDHPVDVDLPPWARLADSGTADLATVPIGASAGVATFVTVGPGERSEPIDVTVRPSSCRPGDGSVVGPGRYDLVVQVAGAEGRAAVVIG